MIRNVRSKSPIWSSYFLRNPNVKLALFLLDILRAGKDQVHLNIQSLLEAKTELIVFDATTEEDVGHIAEWVARTSYKTLWAGSAGLADFLPSALSLPVHSSESSSKR